MPTPFSHIVLAERILKQADLSEGGRTLLEQHRPSFLLGNTAPDLGSLADRPRHETHFFRVPIMRRKPAHLQLLAQYPELSDPHTLPPAQSAFIAGYLAHLWLDQAWILKVFQPYFGQRGLSGSFHDRLVEHNLLRAKLDQNERSELPSELDSLLSSAQPDGWLPFASDESIRQWRDHLADQVQPQGEINTIEVFASRLNVPAETFAHQLKSREKMDQTFARLPPNHLKSFFEVALLHSTELVSYYLEGKVENAPRSSRSLQQLEVGSVDGEAKP